MFDVNVKIEDNTKRLEQAAEKAAYRSFGHAAASIRKEASASIKRSKEPSEPGEPPHTRKGNLRRALRFHRDKWGAVIGPRHSIVGESGSAHEFGEEYKGADFPERPFMLPALMKNIDRLAADWAGSIGE